MREHVPHGSGALALVAREQVVELQDPGQEDEERVAFGPGRQGTDGPGQPRDNQELAVVEELVPACVAIVQDLAGVVAGADLDLRQRWCQGVESFGGGLIGREVLGRDAQVFLDPVGTQDQLGIEPVPGRLTPGAGGPGDGEAGPAGPAVRIGALGRTRVRVEGPAAGRTSDAGPVDVRWKDLATVGADHLDPGEALDIGMPGEDARRKEVDRVTAVGAVQLLDPEPVEDLTGLPGAVAPGVQCLEVRGHGRLQFGEQGEQAGAVDGGQRGPDGAPGDGVDVPADDGAAELVGLTDRGPAAHEGVEDDRPRQLDGTGIEVHHGRPLGCGAAENHRPEDAPETLCPPFVRMVDGTPDLLAPGLDLGDLAQVLEGKAVFDRPLGRGAEHGAAVGVAGFGDHQPGQVRDGGGDLMGVPFDQAAQRWRDPPGQEQQLVERDGQGLGQPFDQGVRGWQGARLDSRQVCRIDRAPGGGGTQGEAQLLTARLEVVMNAHDGRLVGVDEMVNAWP